MQDLFAIKSLCHLKKTCLVIDWVHQMNLILISLLGSLKCQSPMLYAKGMTNLQETNL